MEDIDNFGNPFIQESSNNPNLKRRVLSSLNSAKKYFKNTQNKRKKQAKEKVFHRY